jgi:hypothetical protein
MTQEYEAHAFARQFLTDMKEAGVANTIGVIETSYVLADSDWHYLMRVEEPNSEQFRFKSLEEAEANKEDASLQTDIPVSDIMILKETRQEVR